MTITATTTALSLPNAEVKTFHNYQVVLPTQLPIKRLYNPLKEQLIQLIKLPNDFNSKKKPNANNTNNEILVRIKMCGINYLSDFKSSAINNSVIHKLRKPIVPGMRIICKIDSIKNIKFLIFPFTTCQLENIHNHPHHVRQQPLSNKVDSNNNTIANNSNSSIKNNCDLIYGKDIDGGLQTHLSVPKSLLIPIPYNISLHDVCFIFDILLPFYKFFQFVKPGKTIILLNDIKKELNEVLLILKIFNINFNSIIIIDGNSLSPRFNNKFETVYCFNRNLKHEAINYCISTGLQATRSKYTVLTSFPVNVNSMMVNPKTHKRHNASIDSSFSSISTLASNTSFKSASMMMGGADVNTNTTTTTTTTTNTASNNKFKNDKTIKYMQLNYHDKPLCIEVLKILSAINFEREDQEKQRNKEKQQQDKQQSPELAHDGIIDDYNYNYVDEYDENINEEKCRQLLINDNDSLVHSTSSTHTGSSTLQMHSQTESDPHGSNKNHIKKNEKKGKRRKVTTKKYHHYSWIWCNKDVYLKNYYDLNDYDVNDLTNDIDNIDNEKEKEKDYDYDYDYNYNYDEYGYNSSNCHYHDDRYDDDEYGIGDNHQNKIIKQMNRLLQDDVNLNRVCYFNSDDHDNDYGDDICNSNDEEEEGEEEVDGNGDDDNNRYENKNSDGNQEDGEDNKSNIEDRNSNTSSRLGNRTYKRHRNRNWAKNINACII